MGNIFIVGDVGFCVDEIDLCELLLLLEIVELEGVSYEFNGN